MPARRAASLAESFALTRALVIRTPHGGGAGRSAMPHLRTTFARLSSLRAGRRCLIQGNPPAEMGQCGQTGHPEALLTLRTPDTRVAHAVRTCSAAGVEGGSSPLGQALCAATRPGTFRGGKH